MEQNLHQSRLFSKTTPATPVGFYSGDKPNSTLRSFTEQHLKQRGKLGNTPPETPVAFTQSIKVKRTTKIFNMHGYWSKKPHDAIRQYIRHYTRPGDLILDPFCGSGGTILSAQLEGRRGIGIDLSPAATFFASTLCSAPPLDAFTANFTAIMRKLRDAYSWLYEWPHDGRLHQIHFGISSMKFKCPKCLKVVSLYRCGGDEEGARCPHEGCGHKIKTNQEKLGFQVDEWHLTLGHGKHFIVKIDGAENAHEGRVQERIGQELLVHQPPILKFPRAGRTQVLSARGIDDMVKLYTPRNLLALCLYRDECLKIGDTRLRNALLFVLTACCLKCSRMMGLNSDGIGRIQKNGLIVQLIVKDVNVFDFLEIAHKGIAAGFDAIEAERQSGPEDSRFSTQSATQLDQCLDSSIDYIFTDPPYGERVQFWESNQVWEAWLGFDSNWQDQEVIVNHIRGLEQDHWTQSFRRSMEECFRVLREGCWITLTYNDRETWPILQDVMFGVGFEPDGSTSAVAMETTAKSEKQSKGEDNTIRDLVVNFRKPRTGERHSSVHFTGEEDGRTFQQKALAVIRGFLKANPGSTKNRISDELISHLVRKRQLEAHDFESLLHQVADEVKEPAKKNLFENEDPDLLGGHEISRWFLKDTEAGAEDAETGTADAAANSIYSFLAEKSAQHFREAEVALSQLELQLATEQRLLQAVDRGDSSESRPRLMREIRLLTEKREKLRMEQSEWEKQALPYNDIHEFFLYVEPRPRSTLEELLEDYCYQTDEGNWRPPLTEAEKKEKGSERQRAVRRKIQRFCNLLEAGEAISENQRPDAPTLAEWIRHCRRTGLHAQGRLLYERGGDLSALGEQAQVDVEEDYQVCVKHLTNKQ